jgi:hypothetical protein
MEEEIEILVHKASRKLKTGGIVSTFSYKEEAKAL